MAGGIFKDEHGKSVPPFKQDIYLENLFLQFFVFSLLANTFYSFGKDTQWKRNSVLNI